MNTLTGKQISVRMLWLAFVVVIMPMLHALDCRAQDDGVVAEIVNKGTKFASLASAMDNISDGDVVALYADDTKGANLEHSITINGNGHKVEVLTARKPLTLTLNDITVSDAFNVSMSEQGDIRIDGKEVYFNKFVTNSSYPFNAIFSDGVHVGAINNMSKPVTLSGGLYMQNPIWYDKVQFAEGYVLDKYITTYPIALVKGTAMAMNTTTKAGYKFVGFAVEDCREGEEAQMVTDVIYQVIITSGGRLDMNGHTLHTIHLEHTQGTVVVKNGSIDAVYGTTNDNKHYYYAGDVEFDNVNVWDNLWVSGHNYTFNGGRYKTIINEKIGEKYGSINFVGNTTFVEKINDEQTYSSVAPVTLQGGVYPVNPGKFANATIAEGYTVKKLDKAPEGAPDASYIFEVVEGKALLRNLSSGNVYGDLQSAMDEAVAGDSFKALTDFNEPVIIDKAITLDLDGHTLDTIYIQTKGIDTEVTIKNGTLKCLDGSRNGSHGYYMKGMVELYNLTVTGTVWIAGHTYTFYSGEYADIENNMFDGQYGRAQITSSTKVANINQSTQFAIAEGIILSGGYYKENPYKSYKQVNIAEGYCCVRRNSSTAEEYYQGYPYCVIKGSPHVLNITGDNGYDTLEDALKEASNGDEIALNTNMENSDGYTIDKAISLVMNGYKIAGPLYVPVASDTLFIYGGTLTGNIASCKEGEDASKYKSVIVMYDVNMSGSLTSDYHHYIIKGGIYHDVELNELGGTIDIYGSNTFVENVNKEAETYTGLTLHGGYYDKGTVNNNNIGIAEGCSLSQLSAAPAEAPNEGYTYVVGPTAEGNYLLTTNAEGEPYIYLITNYRPIETTKVMMHFKFNKITEGVNAIFGSSSSSDLTGNNAFAVWVDGSDNSFCFATGCKAVKSPAGLAKTGQNYYLTLRKGYIEIDTVDNSTNHIYHHDFAVYPFHTTGVSIDFGSIEGTSYIGNMKIYEAKISDASGDKHDFIPAVSYIRKSSDYYETICAYDKIAQRYTTSGFDNRLFQGCVAQCKDGKHYGITSNYAGGEVRCVICGKTSAIKESCVNFNKSGYFDTGYKPNDRTVVKMHYSYISSDGAEPSMRQSFFGVSDGTPNQFFFGTNDGYVGDTVSSKVYYDSPITKSNYSHEGGFEYYLTFSSKGVSEILAGGAETKVIDYKTSTPEFQATKTMTVGTVGSLYSAILLYTFDIYEGDELLHHFIPATGCGKKYFYDTVDSTYHEIIENGYRMVFTSFSVDKEHSYETVSTADGAPVKVCHKCGNRVHGDYLKTARSASFSTDQKFQADTKIEFAFKLNDLDNFDYSEQFLVTANDGKSFRGLYIAKDDKKMYWDNRDRKCCTNAALQVGQIYYVKCEGNQLSVSSDNKNWETHTYSGNLNNPSSLIQLFRDQNTRIAKSWYPNIDFYYCIVTNGTTQRRYLPYTNKADAIYEAVTDAVVNAVMPESVTTLSTSCQTEECVKHLYVEKSGSDFVCKICGKKVEGRNYISTAGSGCLNTQYMPTVDTEVRLYYNNKNYSNYQKNQSSEEYYYEPLFGALNSYNQYTLPSCYYLELVIQKKNYGMLGDIEEYIVPENTDQFLVFGKNRLSVYSSPKAASPIYTYTRDMKDDEKQYVGTTELTVGAKNNTNQMAGDIDIYSFDICEKGSPVRHFIPASKDKTPGFFETIQQKFYRATGTVGAFIETPCTHNYLDYCQKDNVWYKICRQCGVSEQLTDEELNSENYIRTNGYSFYDTGCDKKLGNTSVSLDIDSINASKNLYAYPIYENGKLTHYFIPSRYQGKLGMYDTADGSIHYMVNTAGGNLVNATSYIPECKYHKYYTMDKDDAGNYVKHCMICDAEVPLNVLKVTNKAQLEKLEPESDIYTIYLDMSKNGKQQQYVGTTYPEMNDNSYVFELATLQEGYLKHYFLPGIYNKQKGVYDAVMDTFIVMPNVDVQIVNCDHKYHKTEYSDGYVSEHCYICDAMITGGYYMDITFDGGGAENGEMGVQRIVNEGTLKLNKFHKRLGIFDNWSMRDNVTGGTVHYKDGDKVKVDKLYPQGVTCTAEWVGAFTYNGDTLAIDDNKNTENIEIVDDGEKGFASARDFAGGRATYTRDLTGSNSYGTICVPFAIESDEHPDFDLYIADYVTDGHILHLKSVDFLNSGKPGIFRMKDAGSTNLYVEHKANGKYNMFAKTPEIYSGNTTALNGVFEDSIVDCTKGTAMSYYAVQNDTFYEVKTSFTVRPYHAFITLGTKSASAPARLTLDFGDGDATSIMTCEDGSLVDVTGAEFYTTSGVRLNKPQPGINIVKLKNGETVKIKN